MGTAESTKGFYFSQQVARRHTLFVPLKSTKRNPVMKYLTLLRNNSIQQHLKMPPPSPPAPADKNSRNNRQLLPLLPGLQRLLVLQTPHGFVTKIKITSTQPTLVLAAVLSQSSESSKTAPDQDSYLSQAGSILSPINAVASQDKFRNSDSLFQLDCTWKFLFLPPLSTARMICAQTRWPTPRRSPTLPPYVLEKSQPPHEEQPKKLERVALCVRMCKYTVREAGTASQGQPWVSDFIGSFGARQRRCCCDGEESAPFSDISGNPSNTAPTGRPSVNHFTTLAAVGAGDWAPRSLRDTT